MILLQLLKLPLEPNIVVIGNTIFFSEVAYSKQLETRLMLS